MTVASETGLFLDSIAIERRRRLDGRAAPDPHARVLWERALGVESSPASRGRLQAAYGFVEGIDYRHKGLASDIYAAHPLRVAAMALLTPGSPGVEAGVVGILHNVLEVSDVTESELRERFGESVTAQVRSLAVNRALQFDPDYTEAYYSAINAGPRAARVIKVFDKLDNLFLLGINPDVAAKTKYAREIQDYVLPMADSNVPAVSAYMRALLDETIVSEDLELSSSTPRGDQ